MERHNATLAETLRKVMAEGKTDLETALAWTVSAKNSLMNVHGFSPAQLALGMNPQLPSVMEDKLPALEPMTGEDIITKNLKCMRDARKAFIETESSERVKRALTHNVRPSANNKFVNGDIVYYKSNDSRRWKGPGKVIGHDSTNVLIKHGAGYVRAHTCRVLPDRVVPEEQETSEATESDQNTEKDSDEDLAEEETQYSSESEEYKSPESENEREVNTRNEETNSNLMRRSREESQSQPIVKKGLKIEYKDEENRWQKGQVVRRTGKSTGKYKDFWEIKNSASNELIELDMNRNKQEWKMLETETEQTELELAVNSTTKQNESVEDETQEKLEAKHILIVEESLKEKNQREIKEAKKDEIQKWVQEVCFEIAME